MKTNKLLFLLLILTFVKGIVWAVVIPPFQSPDEQNHFAYLQLVAEKNSLPKIPYENNVSRELILATEYLNFNWEGSHPMWNKNTAFNNFQTVKEKINNIPIINRREFIGRAGIEKYSPLYYLVISPIYKIFYGFNLLDRLFFSRLGSILFAVITVYATFKISNSLAAASLVSFHPSFTFVTSTLNNDSMAIALSTLTILALVIQSEDKWDLKKSLSSLVWSLLSTLTRIQLGILVIFSSALSVIKLLYLRKKILNTLIILISGLLLISFSLSFARLTDIVSRPQISPYKYVILRIQQTTGATTYIEVVNFFKNLFQSGKIGESLSRFLQVNAPHYINEVFPWYWAVFGWLEITLPPLFYTILKFLTIISAIGIIKNIRMFKNPKIITAFLSAIFLALPIILYNFVIFINNNVDIGVQGRHFLPAISVHMIFFLLGLRAWIKKIYLVILTMAAFNFLSLIKITEYFYGFENTLQRISAFKPDFLNQNLILIIFSFYTSLVLLYFFKLSRLKQDE